MNFYFLAIFEFIDLQGLMNFFSGLADIILDRFLKQKLVLNIFLIWVYLKGSKFSLEVKASRVLAMKIFLFSLLGCFSFSIF